MSSGSWGHLLNAGMSGIGASYAAGVTREERQKKVLPDSAKDSTLPHEGAEPR